MKILSLLFIAVLLLQYNTLAQEGWFEQSSSTTVNLNSVFFVNSNVGWVVGDAGTILHTIDGGNNWNPQTSNSTDDLHSVQFTDDNTGWASGDVLLKTTNGGDDWDTLNTPGLGAAYFLDNNIGWCASGYDLMKTADGGLSWDLIHTFSNYFSPLNFLNDNIGWVEHRATIGWDKYFRTSEGGSSWNEVWTGKVSLSFMDDSVGWACRDHRSVVPFTSVYKTEDAGESWNEQFNVNNIFWDIFFTNYYKGWVIGYDSLGAETMSIWCTTDEGVQWNIQPIGTKTRLNALHFTDENNGWAVGDSGTIYYTTNGGVSIIEENEIAEIPTNYFLSNNFPNPFNPITKIRYSVPQSSSVIIKVFDLLGNEIETLVNEERDIGTYEITWYAEQLPSGVYFYQIKAGEYVNTKKMLLLK